MMKDEFGIGKHIYVRGQRTEDRGQKEEAPLPIAGATKAGQN
jgi:hypothetical protein